MDIMKDLCKIVNENIDNDEELREWFLLAVVSTFNRLYEKGEKELLIEVCQTFMADKETMKMMKEKFGLELN